jgi:L-glyceraldehyde 3-phosphate reductase
MGLDYVDIFYSHRPDPDTPLEETMSALASAVQQGKALYVGISNYSADQTREACRVLGGFGTRCLIHQPAYSMLNRWVEDGLLDVLSEQGVGCIAFSPLAQGLLTDRYLNGIPADSRVAKPHGFLKRDRLDAETLRKVQQLNQLAQRRGQSLAQMALAWLLRDSRVTSVLVGVSRWEQLEQNLKILGSGTFARDELTSLDAVLTSA